MDGVDEPCSPTPPTGHQHQSGHVMCYETRTSSRALDNCVCDGLHSMGRGSTISIEATFQIQPAYVAAGGREFATLDKILRSGLDHRSSRGGPMLPPLNGLQ